jgi:hypothetical protein
LIPTPIRQVLSTMRKHQVQALLMGGQACVFYGAAQFSKNIDLVLLPSEANYTHLHTTLRELNAWRIAVPPFDSQVLARGHAVHFRCQGGVADGLRLHLLTRLRDLADFEILWARRTTIQDRTGEIFELLAVEDLVQAKKTQRDKDWPVIAALVEGHFKAFAGDPTPERIAFWLMESRTPERLFQLVRRFPSQADSQAVRRPLLRLAFENETDRLREALDAEVRAEQARDRAYWAPLKAELEAFRRAERQSD